MELAAPRHGRIPARSGKRPTRHRRPTGDSRHDHPDAPARRRGHPWPLVAAPGMTATSMLGLGECHNSTARSARNFHSPLRVPKTLHRAKSGIQSHLRSSTEPRISSIPGHSRPPQPDTSRFDSTSASKSAIPRLSVESENPSDLGAAHERRGTQVSSLLRGSSAWGQSPDWNGIAIRVPRLRPWPRSGTWFTVVRRAVAVLMFRVPHVIQAGPRAWSVEILTFACSVG
jgi:hypothetical protein